MMGKLGDMCMEDVRKARAVFWCSGDAELAAQLTKWLEEMEKELAEEQEPKTVVLQEPDDGYDRKYRQIDKIEPVGDDIACLYDVPVCHVTGTHPMCGGYLENSTCVITGDPAEVTRIARDAWPDFDCPGAEPRLRPTVTLHKHGSTYVYRTITRIKQSSGMTWVDGEWWEDDEQQWSPGESETVDESPAEITVLARDAWSTKEKPWSCPGAEPPVVFLQDLGGGALWYEVTGIDTLIELAHSSTSRIHGFYLDPITEKWVETEHGIYSKLTEADIIAAAAAAGVPCPPEPNPLAEGLVGVWVTGHHHQSMPCCEAEEPKKPYFKPMVEELRERVAELEATVTVRSEAIRELQELLIKAGEVRCASHEIEVGQVNGQLNKAISERAAAQEKLAAAQKEFNKALRHHDEYVVEMTDKCNALQTQLDRVPAGAWRARYISMRDERDALKEQRRAALRQRNKCREQSAAERQKFYEIRAGLYEKFALRSCSRCLGSGRTADELQCPKCEGLGVVADLERNSVQEDLSAALQRVALLEGDVAAVRNAHEETNRGWDGAIAAWDKDRATLQSRLDAREASDGWDLHGGMRVSRLSQSPRGHAVIRIAIPHSAIEVAISPNNGKLSVRIDDEPDGSDDAEAKGETPDA